MTSEESAQAEKDEAVRNQKRTCLLAAMSEKIAFINVGMKN